MTRPGGIILNIAFVFFMAVCGLVAGTYVGGRFFVPPGSGLAGPGIALGYGVIGAALAGIAGGLLARFLPSKWFLGVGVPVAVAGVALTIVVVNAYLRAEAEMAAHLEEAYERLNEFSVTLVHLDDDAAPFKRMDVNWGERRYTAITNDVGSSTCAAMLSGREAVALLGALREVEGVVLKNPLPCSGTPGAVERELNWFIPEHLPPDSQGKHAITAACAARHPALDKPFEAAAGIFRRGDHARECG
jgi:hypothetical protein